MSEPTPIDPDHPGAVVEEPSEPELRSLRRLVAKSLNGHVLSDRHDHRGYRLKQAPGKFRSVNIGLTSCGHDHVLCDIPIEGSPKAAPMRICLICDAGRELLGLNGKPQ